MVYLYKPRPKRDPLKSRRYKRVDWAQVREIYFAQKINDMTLSAVDFCRNNGVDYEMFRQVHSRLKWKAQLEDRIREHDRIVSTKLAERSAAAIEGVQDSFKETEIDIRKRHAFLAKVLQEKGMTRLKNVNVDKISVRDAIELVKLGVSEERRALGLPDEFSITTPSGGGGFKPVEAHINEANRMAELGNKLLSYIEGTSKRVKDKDDE